MNVTHSFGDDPFSFKPYAAPFSPSTPGVVKGGGLETVLSIVTIEILAYHHFICIRQK